MSFFLKEKRPSGTFFVSFSLFEAGQRVTFLAAKK